MLRYAGVAVRSQTFRAANRPGTIMIVIFWRGLGILVLLIVAALGLVAKVIVSLTLREEYFGDHKWPFAVSLLASAVSCWFLGSYLEKRPAKIARDEQTGREIYVEPRHEFFFLPIIAWSVILVFIAAILFAVELAG
jgi:hypothetical protein